MMVEVTSEDIQFLKDEYREAVKLILEYQHEYPTLATHQKGVKRGLETALVRMGVLNDELDGICNEVYETFMDQKACEKRGFNQDGTPIEVRE